MANNLKKIALISAIAGASLLPVKSDARTPKKNKKDKVEITLNPTEIQKNIDVMAVDSANMANITKFGDEFKARTTDWHTTTEILMTQIDDVYKILQELMRTNAIDFATYLRIKMMIQEMGNVVKTQTAANLVVLDYLEKTGVKTVNPPKDINQQLMEQRMLLQMAKQKTK